MSTDRITAEEWRREEQGFRNCVFDDDELRGAWLAAADFCAEQAKKAEEGEKEVPESIGEALSEHIRKGVCTHATCRWVMAIYQKFGAPQEEKAPDALAWEKYREACEAVFNDHEAQFIGFHRKALIIVARATDPRQAKPAESVVCLGCGKAVRRDRWCGCIGNSKAKPAEKEKCQWSGCLSCWPPSPAEKEKHTIDCGSNYGRDHDCAPEPTADPRGLNMDGWPGMEPAESAPRKIICECGEFMNDGKRSHVCAETPDAAFYAKVREAVGKWDRSMSSENYVAAAMARKLFPGAFENEAQR